MIQPPIMICSRMNLDLLPSVVKLDPECLPCSIHVFCTCLYTSVRQYDTSVRHLRVNFTNKSWRVAGPNSILACCIPKCPPSLLLHLHTQTSSRTCAATLDYCFTALKPCALAAAASSSFNTCGSLIDVLGVNLFRAKRNRSPLLRGQYGGQSGGRSRFVASYHRSVAKKQVLCLICAHIRSSQTQLDCGGEASLWSALPHCRP